MRTLTAEIRSTPLMSLPSCSHRLVPKNKIELILFKLPNLFINFNRGWSLSSTTYDDINSREYYGERVFPCKVVTDVKLHTIGFDCNQRKISVDIIKY